MNEREMMVCTFDPLQNPIYRNSVVIVMATEHLNNQSKMVLQHLGKISKEIFTESIPDQFVIFGTTYIVGEESHAPLIDFDLFPDKLPQEIRLPLDFVEHLINLLGDTID
ncbi:hypothetical protein TNCV_2755661 [Trichonephila clavipes]|nr:hypothetical protein TNCV_2755661 [Trichonephila clavipes]